MIRFTATGTAGNILGMGLSFGNLDELQAGHPIVFDLAPYGSEGNLVIACGDAATMPGIFAAFPGSHPIVLTERTLDGLRAGAVHTIPLADIHVPELDVGILFAGATEYEIIDQLRTSGLLPPGVPVEGLERYEQHERNAVPDCPLCREQRHGRAAAAAPVRGDWRQRVYRHPNLVALAVLALACLAALVIELVR